MTAANDAEATRNEAADAGCIAQDFLLGGRTSASAECGHWSGKAVRWSNCAILLRIYLLEKRSTLQPEATQGYGGEMAGNVPLRCRRSGPIDWLTKAQQSVWIFVPTSSFSCALIRPPYPLDQRDGQARTKRRRIDGHLLRPEISQSTRAGRTEMTSYYRRQVMPRQGSRIRDADSQIRATTDDSEMRVDGRAGRRNVSDGVSPNSAR